MVTEPRVVQFWPEIIFVISNRKSAAHLFDFEITRMISAQIALHSVQFSLLIHSRDAQIKERDAHSLSLEHQLSASTLATR